MARIRSPVLPPPSWGQAVAPPPTPHFTPNTSPKSVNLYRYAESEPASLAIYSKRSEWESDDEVDGRQPLRRTLLRRSHRRKHHQRLHSSGSNISRCSSSKCPNLCHQNCQDDNNLASQPELIVYGYTFDGDVIGRRPLRNPTTDLGIFNQLGDNPNRTFRSGSQSNQRSKLTSSYDCSHDLQTTQPQMLTSKPQSLLPLGEGKFTGLGSISPKLSPIINIRHEVTRLTTSPATPPCSKVAKVSILCWIEILKY